jgi:hypothetical protein
MGLFDKMKDAQAQAKEAMAGAGAGAGMGGGVPGAGGMDMNAIAAESAKMQKISQAGVEAPGVIHTIRPSGQTDVSGAQRVAFDVSVRPADGEPYQTTIEQSMLPAQMEGLSDGQAITVKYDPDAPTSAIIFSW